MSVFTHTSCARDCGPPEDRGTETYLVTDAVNEQTIVLKVKAVRQQRLYKQCTSPQFAEAEAEAVDQRIDISHDKISFNYTH